MHRFDLNGIYHSQIHETLIKLYFKGKGCVDAYALITISAPYFILVFVFQFFRSKFCIRHQNSSEILTTIHGSNFKNLKRFPINWYVASSIYIKSTHITVYENTKKCNGFKNIGKLSSKKMSFGTFYIFQTLLTSYLYRFYETLHTTFLIDHLT